MKTAHEIAACDAFFGAFDAYAKAENEAATYVIRTAAFNALTTAFDVLKVYPQHAQAVATSYAKAAEAYAASTLHESKTAGAVWGVALEEWKAAALAKISTPERDTKAYALAVAALDMAQVKQDNAQAKACALDAAYTAAKGNAETALEMAKRRT